MLFRSVFRKMRFFKPEISEGDNSTYEHEMLYQEYINVVSMISCLETEKKYIECFIMNVDFLEKFNVSIYNNSFDENVFVKLNSSILDNNTIENNDIFYKCIHLKEEISVFIYFFNYDSQIINIQIKNLVIDNNTPAYYLENYLKFTEKIEIENSIAVDRYYNSEDVVKINNFKFADRKSVV